MQSMKRDWLKCYEASDFTAFLELLSCYAFKNDFFIKNISQKPGF